MQNLDIPGVRLRRLTSYGDDRGFFREVARFGEYDEAFLQSNHSRSSQGTLRGLHYHRGQADLWYVVRGRIQVGLADIRRGNDLNATSIILNAEEPSTLYIPPNIAHGFLALADVDLIYWVTREFDASDEHGIAWDDPLFAIPWESSDPILSSRDKKNPSLDQVWKNVFE